MKKLLLCTLIIFLIPVFSWASDDDSGDMTDLLKYSDTFDSPFAGQKQITDEDFQKTVDELKAKKQKKLRKKDRPMKGQTYKQNDEGDYIDETAEGYMVLNVPLALINGDGTDVSAGYYKVIGKKESNDIYLELYQAHKLIAKIPAIETSHDFDQDEVVFVKILPYNSERVKIIFGSIDFNAYTFVKIKN